MLKIVVFDGGFGGELFADKLEEELPIVEVVRVIDWRNAAEISKSPLSARKAAERALRPYLGKVDLIVLANYLLSITSLGYFRRKYKEQKFVGFPLQSKRIAMNKPTLVLTTRAVTRNLPYITLIHRLRARTVCFDNWPALIDDGELTRDDIERDLGAAMASAKGFSPEQVLLACGQFVELLPQFRRTFGHNVRMVDGFKDTVEEVCKTLRIKSVAKRK